ncbi:uncharacterized protein LOC126899402 [Daktulosphaira vitifoliae]|uniref:uncharacterized protein LOC126899402 n=1 Tax=Daktulosphaira vitifoliae TaxID=58002 RepID=UPI0021A99B4D|nr:uncharacterized protein LOC126899402 [Daktulosphaira vitifoliae]
MFTKIYYFIYFLLWSIQFDKTNCELANVEYTEYLFEIVDYVRVHNGNIPMQNLKNGLMENPVFIRNLGLYLNNDNFTSIFDAIIESLNNKYTMVLGIFHENIGFILQQCDNYHSTKQFKNFLDCFIILDDAVESSRILFDKLYNVMKFFSSLNIKFAFKMYKEKHIIIDELSFVIKYLNSKKQIDILNYTDQNGSNPQIETAYKNFVNIKRFHQIIASKNFFIYTIYYKNILQVNIEENDDAIEHDNYSIKRLQYVQNVCIVLKEFYAEAVKIEYVNLGFHNLLHPTTPGLIPPTYDSSKDLGIYVINTLFKEIYWQSLYHTKIRLNSQTKDINEIQHDEVNEINFHSKKQDVAHMLKCRFSAVLNNITVSLTAMQHLCMIENANKSYGSLIFCTNALKSTFPSATIMLNSLLAILALLKKAFIWDYEVTSLSCLKQVSKITSAYVQAMKNQYNFSFKMDHILKGIRYFEKVYKTLSSLSSTFSNTKIYQFLVNNCDFDIPILNDLELIDSFKIKPKHHIDNLGSDTLDPDTLDLETLDPETLDSNKFVFLKISSHLKQICEDFVKTDYDLGFSKLVNQYIIQ